MPMPGADDEPLHKRLLDAYQNDPQFRQEIEKALSADAQGKALSAEAEAILKSLQSDAVDRPHLAERLKRFDSLQPGDELGNYTLMSFLDKGAMGKVFTAVKKRPSLDTETYALKVLNPLTEISHSVQRFRKEAQTLKGLHQVNIVRFYDMEVCEGLLYYSMEYIKGESLRRRINRFAGQPQPWRWAADVVRQIALALAHVNATHADLVHRDIKPENIMVCDALSPAFSEGVRAVLCDFGLALDLSVARTTSAHWIPGTLLYFSPEQTRPELYHDSLLGIDYRSDVFSLGLVAYELLTGRHPFVEKNATSHFDVFPRICKEHLRPIRKVNPQVDGYLSVLVDEMLSKNRDERPPPHAVADTLSLILNKSLPHHERQFLLASIPGAFPNRSRDTLPLEPRVPYDEIDKTLPIAVIDSVDDGRIHDVPTEILDLEVDLRKIENTLAAIDEGTHVDIETICLRENVEKKDVLNIAKALKPLIEQNPNASASDLCSKVSDHPLGVVVQTINVVRNRRQLHIVRDEKIQRLIELQKRDYESLIRKVLFSAEKSQFPLTKWGGLLPHVRVRRYRFLKNEYDMLQYAEKVFAEYIGEIKREKAARDLAIQKRKELPGKVLHILGVATLWIIGILIVIGLIALISAYFKEIMSIVCIISIFVALGAFKK